MAIKGSKKESEIQDVIDIDLGELQKKKFRLDRDNNRVIELNTSDISVAKRLDEVYPKMLELTDKAHSDNDDEAAMVDALVDINEELKKMINYVFDSDVADKACPSGTLYDPINGKFRFEYILEKLLRLYDENFENELNLMRQRVNKHTAKYTKKRK